MGVSPFLQRAYDLARAARPHPNPRVGAVVVSPGGEILGEGFHEGPGAAHAEVRALDAAADARDSTVYVSLEPCSHVGRTPPCVDRLISEGVARVVVGALDPDFRVSGEGVSRLRASGVQVDIVADPAARDLDPGYFRHRETGLPFVILKYAMTLDGAVAAADGSSQWITSEPARRDAHELRASVDAVVIGSGTLAADDPRLDVRLEDFSGEQPRAVVIAGESELPDDVALWEREPIVVATTQRRLPSGDLIVVEGGSRPSPEATCRALAAAGLLTLLVEGGPTLAGSWQEAGLINRGVAYVGARLASGTGMSPMSGTFGSIADAHDVSIRGVRRLGPDVRIDFEVDV